MIISAYFSIQDSIIGSEWQKKFKMIKMHVESILRRVESKESVPRGESLFCDID